MGNTDPSPLNIKGGTIIKESQALNLLGKSQLPLPIDSSLSLHNGTPNISTLPTHQWIICLWF